MVTGSSFLDASPLQQERRGDAFHGDLGVWPVIWSVPVSSNAVALTFDDGPDPEFTPKILDILERYRAPATFNMMGRNCVEHPDIVAAVVAARHEIGNHTWSHMDLAEVDPPTARSEMRRGRDAIETVSGRELTFFRPPRGELSGATIRYAAEQRQSILMWTVNGGLRTLGSPRRVRDALVLLVKPGYIVGMHDGIGGRTIVETEGGDVHRRPPLPEASMTVQDPSPVGLRRGGGCSGGHVSPRRSTDHPWHTAGGASGPTKDRSGGSRNRYTRMTPWMSATGQ